MKHHLRFFVFACLLVGVGAATAQTCKRWRWQFPDPWFSSMGALTSDWASKQTKTHAWSDCTGTVSFSNFANVTATSGVVTGFTYTRQYSGCTNSIGVTGGAATQPGQFQSVVEDAAGACPNPCTAKAGQQTVMNATVCYSRGAAGTDWSCVGAPNQLPEGGSTCDGTCSLTIGSAIGAYSSAAATAQGLYRKSLDMTMTFTGQQCTGATPALSVAQTGGPPCPGALGEVNGKPYCAGTAAQPVANDQPAPPPIPPSDGNPRAGEKPVTGEGSGSGPGRTPSTGGGGPEGGPAGAVGSGTTIINNNGNPTGTTTKPGEGTEQANCGAPGQPKCGIDEAGTPQVEAGKWDSAADAYKATKDANRGTMSGDGDKGFFNGWASFFFAPPVAQCQPFTMPSMQGMAVPDLDPCAVVDGVRQVMAYIWALTALYLCVGMVTRTVRGTA